MSIEALTRNAVDVLPEGGLEAKVRLGRPLRVKLGIDVTSPDIHIGRAVPLQRMRAFQDEGHVGVLIVGDYTTRIGDPSGRSSERPILSDDEIERRVFHRGIQHVRPDFSGNLVLLLKTLRAHLIDRPVSRECHDPGIHTPFRSIIR